MIEPADPLPESAPGAGTQVFDTPSGRRPQDWTAPLATRAHADRDLERVIGRVEDGERIDADAIRLEGDPVGREASLRTLLVRSGMDDAEVEAVFERVPPAYRDVVAAYLLRIARDEAAGAGEAPDRESE